MTQTVKVTMIDSSVWYVDNSEFTVAGITTPPDSVIGNYIKGSRGPMLKANSAVNGTGTETYLNPHLIVRMDVTYS
jgi:hypothetical protein